jgi:hypothetical protein
LIYTLYCRRWWSSLLISLACVLTGSATFVVIVLLWVLEIFRRSKFRVKFVTLTVILLAAVIWGSIFSHQLKQRFMSGRTISLSRLTYLESFFEHGGNTRDTHEASPNRMITQIYYNPAIIAAVVIILCYMWSVLSYNPQLRTGLIVLSVISCVITIPFLESLSFYSLFIPMLFRRYMEQQCRSDELYYSTGRKRPQLMFRRKYAIAN